LKIDGTAFFGKANKGRIIFDGNSGVIKSALGGMEIDIDDGIIRSNKFILDAWYSDHGILIDNNGPEYLKVGQQGSIDNYIIVDQKNGVDIATTKFKLDAWNGNHGIEINSNTGTPYLKVGADDDNILEITESNFSITTNKNFTLDAWDEGNKNGLYISISSSDGY
jgi:hypothetical protein